MKKFLAVLVLLGWMQFVALAGDSTRSDVASPEVAIQPTPPGQFHEDINSTADGGLYGEMVQNRSFEHKDHLYAWTNVGSDQAGVMLIATNQPLNSNNPTYLRLVVSGFEEAGFGAANSGFGGMTVRKGENYRVSVWARRGAVLLATNAVLLARLEDEKGETLGFCRLEDFGREWQHLTGRIECTGDSDRARLLVLARAGGQYDVDMISLCPENTWQQRTNGLRALTNSALTAHLLPSDQAKTTQPPPVEKKPAPETASAPAFWKWAETPPMGWNSWDCFATTVTEAQTKAQADVMAEKLKSHGWQYIVVDIQWYEPDAKSFDYRTNASLTMDEFGRLLPATNRFPSAAHGVGFKALADYVHDQGLKFGIHLMRGIPRQAVRENAPVKGTDYRASDVANTNSTCKWNPDMFGVDMSKPGAQEYYDSVFALVASWGVDFVKVDDLSRPYPQNRPEVEAIRTAIDRSGRAMVLSTSPGETPVAEGAHVMRHANMWRISDDFWDKWSLLFQQFARLNKWSSFIGPGHWPDADMLPLGVVDMGKRKTRLTPDEQITLMTLWSIARSPLMMGGDLTKLDDFTLSLLTNDAVLAVNQASSGNQELFRRDGLVAWVADVPGSEDRYLALFNAHNADTNQAGGDTVRLPVKMGELGFDGECRIDDLWMTKSLGTFTDEFAPELNWHGAGLYRVSGRRTQVPSD